VLASGSSAVADAVAVLDVAVVYPFAVVVGGGAGVVVEVDVVDVVGGGAVEGVVVVVVAVEGVVVVVVAGEGVVVVVVAGGGGVGPPALVPIGLENGIGNGLLPAAHAALPHCLVPSHLL